MGKKYNKEEVLKMASGYISEQEFRKANHHAYYMGRKAGWFDGFEWSVPALRQKRYTFEEIVELGKGCSGGPEFRDRYPVAYRQMLEKGTVKDFYSLMPWENRRRSKPHIWTKEACFAESRKYSSLYDFRTKSFNVYNICCKRGWLGEMTWIQRTNSFNVDTLLEGMRRYKDISELRKRDPKTYRRLSYYLHAYRISPEERRKLKAEAGWE